MAVALAGVVGALVLAADPLAPRGLYTVPLAVSAGFTGKLTVRGLRLDTVQSVGCSRPGVQVKLLGPPRRTNAPANVSKTRGGDSECEVELSVPAGFPEDQIPLVFTAAGRAARPFPVPVDSPGVIVEKEPNSGFAAANPVTMPAVFGGVLEQDRDVDVVKCPLLTGVAVRIEVLGHGSPIDPLVMVWSANRQIVATLDARSGPRGVFTPPTAGDYFISITDANDRSGPHFGYRLRVTRADLPASPAEPTTPQ